MLKIKIICVGDFKENYLKEAEKEYLKRLSKFFEVSTIVVKESDKEREGKEIVSKIDAYAILLDIKGQEVSSEELATKIDKLSLTNSKLNIIIGGSDGVSELVKNSVKERISFGKITLPHQLARIVALEQLYRSGTILNHIKYHK